MKRKTILNHKDFFVPKSGVFAPGEIFVVLVKPTKFPGDARYGLVVSKRKFKLAVHRNRAKRLLRDWIAYNESLMLPDIDYIFVAFDKVLDTDRDVGRKEMACALKRVARLYKKYGFEN